MHPERRRRFSDQPAAIPTQPLTQPQPDHTSLESASPCALSTPLIRSMGYAPLEVLAAKADLPFSGQSFWFPTSPTAFSSTMAQQMLTCIPAPHADDRTAFTGATGSPIWTNILRAALKWAYTITPAVGGDPRLHADEGRVHLVWLLSSTLPVSCICKTGIGALPDLIASTIKFFQLHSSARAADANASRSLQVPHTPGTASADTEKSASHPAVRPTKARSDETERTEKKRQPAYATSATAQSSADSKNPVSKVLRNATVELEDAQDPLSEKDEAAGLDKKKKKSKKEKKKKVQAVDASRASSAATAAIDQPSVEVPKSKKRRHRDEEEDVRRKNVKKRKAQSSISATIEAATAVTLVPDPKGKGPAKPGHPASAPTKKMKAASSNTPASVFPMSMAPRKVRPPDALAEKLNGRSGSRVHCASGSSSNSSSGSSSEDDVNIPARSAVSVVRKLQANPVAAIPPKIKEETPDSEDEVKFVSENVRRKTNLPLRPSPVERRPQPTIDPAAKKKENRVFKADVDKSLLQKEVDYSQFLESVMDELGIDKLKRKQIYVRVMEKGDSLENAIRATCAELSIARRRYL